jgi:hypothetical protein
MARCKANKKSAVTGKVILVCDLDEGHDMVHPKHFDKVEMTTWNQVSNEPTPVPSTRTTPPRQLIAKAAKKAPRALTASVAAHTQQFEVLSA